MTVLKHRFTFLGVFLRQGLACTTGWPLVDAPAWASPELGLWALTTVLLGGGLCETESEYIKDWMNPHRETFSSQLPCCSTHGSHSLIALDLHLFANYLPISLILFHTQHPKHRPDTLSARCPLLESYLHRTELMKGWTHPLPP